jgi:hypothetical protein
MSVAPTTLANSCRTYWTLHKSLEPLAGQNPVSTRIFLKSFEVWCIYIKPCVNPSMSCQNPGKEGSEDLLIVLCESFSVAVAK